MLKLSVLTTLMATVAIVAGTAIASAQDAGPAIVYGTSGKFDKSFNEMAYAGAEKFKADTGADYRDYETQADSQAEQGIRNFASRGFSPIVVTNFAYADQLKKVAGEFPDTQFVMIDDVVDAPNVRSVTFKEHEGSYLVGLIAGLVSNIGTFMHLVAASWAMTLVTDSPTLVGLVQTAWAVPGFLLALHAGAFVDMIDRRRLIVATQIAALAVAAVLGVLQATGNLPRSVCWPAPSWNRSRSRWRRRPSWRSLLNSSARTASRKRWGWTPSPATSPKPSGRRSPVGSSHCRARGPCSA